MFSRSNLYGNLLKKSVSCATRKGAPTSALLAAPSDMRQFHEVVGDMLCPSKLKGIDYIKDPRLNKELAFTLEERHVLGIHGLMPPRFKTQDEQLEVVKLIVDRYKEPLNKYIFLEDLHDRNECLFFRYFAENIENVLPIIYTPTVGLACQRFGLVFRRPRGLFITINDRGHVFDVMKNWPEPKVRTIIVTDGESILGLGDLGANGMGIPVSKSALYVALAGVMPHHLLPIQIDVGTNNTELTGDPFYIGLRQKRVTGAEYDDLIHEFMEAVVRRYGRNTLIQYEDFATANAFKFLEKYGSTYCTFNADIQGAGSIVVAGLYASMRITKKPLIDNTFLIVGYGECALGSARMIVKALTLKGATEEQARARIFLVDAEGLVTATRKEDELQSSKAPYVKQHAPLKDLEEIVAAVKPTVLIGAFAGAGIFTPKILRTMAENNQRPVVFAMTHPIELAECTAEQAYQNTDGRVIFAPAAKQPPVNINGKTYAPNVASSSYIFSGLVLGIIATGTHYVHDEMFLKAARQLAKYLTQEELDRGSLYPPMANIRDISLNVAGGVIKYAYDKGLATFYPEPRNKRKWHLFNHNYQSQMPVSWTYPRMPFVKTRELDPAKVYETK